MQRLVNKQAVYCENFTPWVKDAVRVFNLSKKIEDQESKAKLAISKDGLKKLSIHSYYQNQKGELQDEESINNKWIRPIMFLEEICKMVGKQVDALHKETQILARP